MIPYYYMASTWRLRWWQIWLQPRVIRKCVSIIVCSWRSRTGGSWWWESWWCCSSCLSVPIHSPSQVSQFQLSTSFPFLHSSKTTNSMNAQNHGPKMSMTNRDVTVQPQNPCKHLYSVREFFNLVILDVLNAMTDLSTMQKQKNGMLLPHCWEQTEDPHHCTK